MCEPVSAANEAALCAAMVAGASEALAGYGSSIEEDVTLLREGGLEQGSRQEMAVQVGAAACAVGGGDRAIIRPGVAGSMPPSHTPSTHTHTHYQ
jgi:hypothetical protein